MAQKDNMVRLVVWVKLTQKTKVEKAAKKAGSNGIVIRDLIDKNL